MADEKKDKQQAVFFDFLMSGAKIPLAKETAARAADDASSALDGPAAEERCEAIARDVDRELMRPVFNLMAKCRGEHEFPHCRPLEMERVRPLFFVLWGDSQCDCIEGDDTEIVTIVVCNPYTNLTMSRFTINRIDVVKADGTPVPLLPDNTPSIQIVPLGPHCFDDIAPCTCVWRQFSLRLRGVPAGDYRILLRGICFEICVHQLQEECVTFRVCKD